MKLADDPITQHRLAEAVWTLDSAISRMRSDAVELWQRAEARDTPTMQERGRYRWNLNRGCDLVGRAVGDLMRAASGRSCLDHPLQSRFQDVQGALGHAFLVPDPVARAVGGALRGMAGFHHLMLEVTDPDEVGRAYDRVHGAEMPITMSLGKHTNDEMFSFYVRTPSGFEIEYGAGGRTIDTTRPWSTGLYDAMSIWGHKSPAAPVPPGILHPARADT